jgi:VIT1/CCC1 family predicted Fe2+/Mn2+ transporter
MEPAVIDAFVARIERRLADRADADERALQRRREHQKEMVLGSMGIAVPMLAFAAIFTGLPGVVTVCVALIAIAVVSSRS